MIINPWESILNYLFYLFILFLIIYNILDQ